MNKEEIAMELTLKTIDKLRIKIHANSIDKDNLNLATQVAKCYNTIYSKLSLNDNNLNIESNLKDIIQIL